MTDQPTPRAQAMTLVEFVTARLEEGHALAARRGMVRLAGDMLAVPETPGEARTADRILREIAAEYSDHPDYREEFR